MRCSPEHLMTALATLWSAAMPEIAPQTVPPVDDFYEALRKHFEAKNEPRFKTLHPIVAPF
jgi:hypothetical protein